MEKVAVVILNWNGKNFLEQFLPQVIKYSAKDAEIIVADNASTDESLAFLRKTYPEIRLIINPFNGGFSKGYNDSLSQIEAKYYILLNSDVEVTPGWINPIIDLMDNDKSIAACQPKILSFHEREKFEYAGAAGGFIDKFGYPFCRGRLFQSIEKDHGQYDDSVEVFWATGACMFVRAEYFHQLGGLDNDFFAHMEEIDLCWRMKRRGYKIVFCPSSVVYHVGGGTLPKKSAFKTYLNIRNNLIMLYKNLPANRLFIVLFLRFFLDLIAAFKFLVDGGLNDFKAVFKAYISFYSTISRHKGKRKLQSHTKVSGIYRGSIVFSHYLFRRKKFSQLNPSRFE
ncbi:MAG: glycosyltransferase family 2 protein [Bacteroidales bacterium]|nr:glycosyltransferase family 2 protein [Bacteroidales bacterium]